MEGNGMKSNFYASAMRIDLPRPVVDKILRSNKAKSLTEYLNHKLQEDLEKRL